MSNNTYPRVECIRELNRLSEVYRNAVKNEQDVTGLKETVESLSAEFLKNHGNPLILKAVLSEF